MMHINLRPQFLQCNMHFLCFFYHVFIQLVSCLLFKCLVLFYLAKGFHIFNINEAYVYIFHWNQYVSMEYIENPPSMKKEYGSASL
jgi:hypothetical protein